MTTVRQLSNIFIKIEILVRILFCTFIQYIAFQNFNFAQYIQEDMYIQF